MLLGIGQKLEDVHMMNMVAMDNKQKFIQMLMNDMDCDIRILQEWVICLNNSYYNNRFYS